jgi:hypothetical protein
MMGIGYALNLLGLAGFRQLIQSTEKALIYID